MRGGFLFSIVCPFPFLLCSRYALSSDESGASANVTAIAKTVVAQVEVERTQVALVTSIARTAKAEFLAAHPPRADATLKISQEVPTRSPAEANATPEEITDSSLPRSTEKPLSIIGPAVTPVPIGVFESLRLPDVLEGWHVHFEPRADLSLFSA
jgi:hypothetical protein